MKFGSAFAQAEDPAFGGAYVPYKLLKRIIKLMQGPPGGTCPRSPAAAEGARRQRRPLAPLDTKTDCQRVFQHELHTAISKVSEVVVDHLAATEGSEELARLAAFAQANVLATRKIIKKYEKKCGAAPDCRALVQGAVEQILTALDTLAGPESLPGPRSAAPAVAAGPVSAERAEEEGLLEPLEPAASREDGAAEEEEMRGGAAPPRPAPAALPPTGQQAVAGLRGLRARSCWAEICLLLCSLGILFCAHRLGNAMVKAAAGVLALTVLVGLVFSLPLKLLALGLLLDAGEVLPAGAPRSRQCVWARLTHGELLRRLARPLAEQGCPEFIAETVAVGRAAPGAALPAPAAEFLHEPRASQDACPCCMEVFAAEDVVLVPRCGHAFCEPCLRAWAASAAQGGGRCPMCRTGLGLEDA